MERATASTRFHTSVDGGSKSLVPLTALIKVVGRLHASMLRSENGCRPSTPGAPSVVRFCPITSSLSPTGEGVTNTNAFFSRQSISLAVFLGLSAISAWAQSTSTGTVSGQVTDQQSAIVAGGSPPHRCPDRHHPNTRHQRRRAMQLHQ